MKYRIKKITYSNGRVDYQPQVKKRFFWSTIGKDGFDSFLINTKFIFRDSALDYINTHININIKIEKVDFEYIDS